MALTKEEWEEVSAATEKLRSLGCAVCVFTPDDVESAIEADDENRADEEADGDAAEVTPGQAATWLEDNIKWLQDGMSTWGNQYIADNVDEIRATAASPETAA